MDGARIKAAMDAVLAARATETEFSVALTWLMEALGRQIDKLVRTGVIPSEKAETVSRALAELAVVTVVGMPEGFDPKPFVTLLPEAMLAELSEVEGPLADLYRVEGARRQGKVKDWSFRRDDACHGTLSFVPVKHAEFVAIRMSGPKSSR